MRSLSDCLSAGLLDFYTKWVIRVFVIPALMLGLVGLQYYFERRRVGHSTAAGYFKANAFVVVFLCYPGVCNQAFGMVSGFLAMHVVSHGVACSNCACHTDEKVLPFSSTAVRSART